MDSLEMRQIQGVKGASSLSVTMAPPVYKNISFKHSLHQLTTLLSKKYSFSVAMSTEKNIIVLDL
jgi:hypothetical protein